MDKQFDRTALIYGEENVAKLSHKRVAIFGLGGVGGYVVEALIRSGIFYFDIFDADIVSVSNLNRQIIATYDTIGRKKVEVMKERMLSINNHAIINTFDGFILPDNISAISLNEYDYIVDAIDTISTKIALVLEAERLNIPIISCMGTGNKCDPSLLKVDDLFKTSICPLAKVMRHELKKRGVKKLKVVYSTETPIVPKGQHEMTLGNGTIKQYPGSVMMVPAVAGLMIATEVINDLLRS